MPSNSNYKSVLFVTCLSTSLVPFMGSALNLALPKINAELALNAEVSAWVITSYLLSTAVFQVPCARLADIFGRRKIFICGILLFFIFSILSGFSSSGAVLIAFRFLCGIGSAMIFSTNIAILTASVPKEKRGWALGINSGTVYFSLSVGPLIGGFFTEKFGWQSIFFMSAAMSLIVAAGILIFIKEEWKDNEAKTFDYIGTLSYGISLSLLIWGFSALPDKSAFAALGAGICLLIFFGLYEVGKKNPVFDIKLFLSNRMFAFSSLSALINYSATTSTMFMLSLYLQYVKKFSPLEAGMVLMAQTIAMTFVALKAGKLSDSISAPKMATVGMFITALSLTFFCFIGETTSIYLIALILVIAGIGFGTFSPPNMNMIMSSVSLKDYGQAAATTGTMRLVGQSFSMGIAMMAISIKIGPFDLRNESGGQLIECLRIIFIISAILCFAGVYLSSVREGGKS